MTQNTLATALAAPQNVTIGETEVDLHPLKLRDFARFETWARGEIISASREMLMSARAEAKDRDEEFDEESAGDVLKFTCAEAAKLSVGTETGQAFFKSLGGMFEILYLSLRQNGKEWTRSRVEEVLSTVPFDETPEFVSMILKLSGMIEADAEPTEGEPAEPVDPTADASANASASPTSSAGG